MSGACGASCPYGLTCTYPGQCPRFTDSGDGICDLAQPSGTSSSTESASSSSYDSDDSYSSSSGSSVSNSDTGDSVVSTDPGHNSSDINTSAVADQGTGMDTSNIPSDNPQYFVFPVTMLLIGLYLLTHFLFSKGILSRKKHRRIWNLLITAGMAGSGITGILLILMINLGIKTALNPSVTFWHVEFSILMVIGTLIHVHLYWKPFKNMFRVLFGFKGDRLKRFKKPVSVMVVLMTISMVVVSGQYFTSSMDGDKNSITTLNSTPQNTSTVKTSTPTSTNYYQDSSDTASSVSSYDSGQNVVSTNTSTVSGKGKGKNRS